MRFIGILVTQVVISYLWVYFGAFFDPSFGRFIFLLPQVALISTIILWWLDRNIRRPWIFNIIFI